MYHMYENWNATSEKKNVEDKNERRETRQEKDKNSRKWNEIKSNIEMKRMHFHFHMACVCGSMAFL